MGPWLSLQAHISHRPPPPSSSETGAVLSLPGDAAGLLRLPLRRRRLCCLLGLRCRRFLSSSRSPLARLLLLPSLCALLLSRLRLRLRRARQERCRCLLLSQASRPSGLPLRPRRRARSVDRPRGSPEPGLCPGPAAGRPPGASLGSRKRAGDGERSQRPRRCTGPAGAAAPISACAPSAAAGRGARYRTSGGWTGRDPSCCACCSEARGGAPRSQRDCRARAGASCRPPAGAACGCRHCCHGGTACCACTCAGCCCCCPSCCRLVGAGRRR